MPQRNLLYGCIILSVLMLLMAHFVLTTPITNSFVEEEVMEDRSRGKRSSFYEIQCNGIYDKSIFSRVDQICEDCYNLFREPKIHSLCIEKCFTSEYFKSCVDVLLLKDDFDKIQEWVRRLNGLGV